MAGMHGADPHTEAATASVVERAQRSSVMLKGEVESAYGVRTTHRVRNLSATGAQIDQAEGLEPNAEVLLCLGALDPIPAHVVWTVNARAGLAFSESIDVTDPRIRMALKERSKVVAPTAGWVAGMVNRYRN